MLDRIPELEVLAGDPKVASALRTGNPHRVYRALWWGRLLGRFKEHRALVDGLLSRRRLFLKPIGSAPTMFTLNGFGFRVYGEAERDTTDGTYIGTHFLTALFLPVFPVRQYLCASEGRQYRFFGSVPFGGATFVWRQALVVAAAVGIVVAGYTTWDSATHREVFFTNGLDFPVTASVAGTDVLVPPDTVTTAKLHVGTHQVVVTDPQGETVDEGPLELVRGGGVVVWNVRGAALVYSQRIPYTLGEEAKEPAPEIFCGRTVITPGNIDFVFKEPPRKISTSKSRGVEWRTHVDVVPGGWRACAHVLAARGQAEVGVKLATDVMDLDSAQDVYLVSSLIADMGGADAALAWVEARLAEHDGVQLHRARQDFYAVAGRESESRALYAARFEQQPDSADAAYLWVRTLTTAEALEHLPELRRRWPDHVPLLRSEAWQLYVSRRFEEALPLIEKLDEVEPGSAEMRAEALVALGRLDDALAALQEQPPATVDDAVLVAEVAKLAGRSTGPAGLSKLDEDPIYVRALFDARLSGIVSDASLARIENPAAKASVEISAALHADGQAALTALRKAPEGTVRELNLDELLLLLGEAVRVGDDELAELLEGATPKVSYYMRALQAIRRGPTARDLEDMPLRVRAEVELAASRRPGIAAREAKRLRDAARQDDLFGTVVTHALDTWPS